MTEQNTGIVSQESVVDTSSQPASVEAKTAPTETAPKTETKESSSILANQVQKTEEAQKYWGDDWKQKLAGEDEKILKNIEKYKSPTDLAKGYLELQKKFSETRPIPQLPKDATPEQVKEYREKLGIPESPDKYEIKLDGVVIGDYDKPVVDAWLEKAHAANMTPAQVNQTLQSYFEVQNKIQSDINQKAEAQNKEFEKTLQKEWGVDYSSNLNLVASHLQKELGNDLFQKLSRAQAPDGTFLINDAKLLNHFLGQAKSLGTNNTITPSNSDTTSLLSRKAELDKIASTDARTWFNSPELRAEAAEIEAMLNKKR